MSLNNIAERTVQKALKMGASQAEISVFTADSALTRYTKNIIHQNVTAEIYYTNVEVAVGKNKRAHRLSTASKRRRSRRPSRGPSA